MIAKLKAFNLDRDIFVADLSQGSRPNLNLHVVTTFATLYIGKRFSRKNAIFIEPLSKK